MTRTKTNCAKRNQAFIEILRELRHQLHDMDTKLEHLIRSQRHFYSLHYQERELDD